MGGLVMTTTSENNEEEEEKYKATFSQLAVNEGSFLSRLQYQSTSASVVQDYLRVFFDFWVFKTIGFVKGFLEFLEGDNAVLDL